MAANEDRDKLKRSTPHAGVRAQTAQPIAAVQTAYESFEDETPIEGDPVTQINARAKNAAASARGAYSAIREVRKELQVAVDRDIADHRVMTASMSQINAKVDTLQDHLADVRENMGGVIGKLDGIWDSLVEERRARVKSAELRTVAAIEIEKHEAIVEIDDGKAEADHRRKFRYRILVIVGSVVTGLVTAAGLMQC